MFQQLSSESEELSVIKQYLNSCLSQNHKLRDVNIFKIDNAELGYRFDKNCRKLVKVVGWTNCKTLGGENNDMQMLAQRGFTFGKGLDGMQFTTGIVNEKILPKLFQEKEEHVLIYSDVAIGRAFVEDNDPHASDIPTGFDSFYIPMHKLDRNDDGEFDLFEYQEAATFDGREPNEYQHKYFVKNVSQILPKYVIRFYIEKIAKVEDLVNESMAAAMNMANGAGGAGGNDEMSVDTMSTTPVPAKNPYDEYEFFDPMTHRPITVKEKMTIGATRTLVTIDTAYKNAVADYEAGDQLIEGKKQWLEKQLDIIDEKVRQVNLNYADVLEKITETVENAKAQLQELTRQKLEHLLSAEVEMRRQKEQIAWMDLIVKKNASGAAMRIDKLSKVGATLSAQSADEEKDSKSRRAVAQEGQVTHKIMTQEQLGFLNIWKNHTKFRNAASRQKPKDHLEVISRVHPDCNVKGEILIYNDPSYSKSILEVTAASGATMLGASANAKKANPNKKDGLANSNKKLGKTLETIEKQDDYVQPPEPGKEILAGYAQSLVDMEAEKIQDALSAAVSDESSILPKSIHRPPGAGMVYKVPLMREFLTTTGADVPNEFDDNEKGYKEMYFLSMRKKVGTNPKFAEELPPPLEEDTTALEANGNTPNSYTDNNQNNIAMATAAAAEKKEQEEEKQKKLERKIEREKLREERQRFEEEKRKFQQDRLERDAQRMEFEQRQLMQSQHFLMSSQGRGGGGGVTSLVDPALRAGTFGQMHLPTMGTSPGIMPGSPSGAFGGDGEDDEEGQQDNAAIISALQHVVEAFRTTSSLTALSNRKKTQLRSGEAEARAKALGLAQSTLLSESDAEKVYFTFPFFSSPPSCHILYKSTAREKFSLRSMYEACLMNKSPTLMILRSGEFVFGCYLSHGLRVVKSGIYAGSPACYLFSITLDLKMPYHARIPPPNTDGLGQTAFLCEHDQVIIGNGDLVISSNGMATSCIEKCYGVGLNVNGPEATCLLAGRSRFAIDEVEVWTIVTNLDD